MTGENLGLFLILGLSLAALLLGVLGLLLNGSRRRRERYGDEITRFTMAVGRLGVIAGAIGLLGAAFVIHDRHLL